MKIYEFTIIISKPNDEEMVVDKLFEVGCDDALFSCSNEEYYLDFNREAESLEEALESACDDIVNADIGSHVKTILD